MDKLISVIVPIYNVEQYLGRCIDSVIKQSYQNLEIILINDGSTDSCHSICETYKSLDSRIHVIHQKNGGLSVARNTGLDYCNGKYIYLLDSDDFIEEDTIISLYTSICEHDADISIGNINKVYCNGVIEPFTQLEDKVLENKREMYKNASMYVTAWGKLYKRDIFKSIRYPKGKLNEDAFVVCDILKLVNKITQVDYYGYNYFQRDGSIMNSNFTLRNLDSVEARLIRVDFYISESIFYEAQENIMNSVLTLYKAYIYLDLKVEKNKDKILFFEKEIKNRFYSLLLKPGKLSYKIFSGLFFINKSFFGFVCKSKGIL